VVFGVAIQASMADSGLGVREVPIRQLSLAVIVSIVFAVLAAVWPSRRAARLNVLRAIASE
jgi:putative ABC transport system permease protein